MAVITFDEAKRREYKEPQTTKTELLRAPPDAADKTYGSDWSTLRGAPGLSDLYTSNSTWGFSNIGNTTTPAVPSVGPVNLENASPRPETVGQKRYHEHGEELDLMNKKARDENNRAVRAVSGTSSDDRFGRKTGVIDLTLDDDSSDEEEQPKPLPERQYVPRAEDDDDDLAGFLRRKSPSPPRTFTRGLSPIAAHPRKTPIVHRSKPPIKPENRKQSTFSPAPTRTAQKVFNRHTRSPSQALNAPRTSTPSTRSALSFSLEGVSLGSTTATSSSTAGNRKQSVAEKPAGPFIQDDDSDDGDEAMAKALGATRSSSLTRLIDRPRQHTPASVNLASIQEESRRMREQALERNQSHFATPTNAFASAPNFNTPSDSTPTLSEEDAVDASRDFPIPSIEFSLQQAANEARQPPVRPAQTDITYQAKKISVCLLDSTTELEKPRKRQKTIPAYQEANKSNHVPHASPRDHFQGLIQRAQTQTKARNTVQPFIQPTKRNHQQPKPSAQDEVRKKAAAAAQQRQTESQNIAMLKARIRQQNEKKAEEERVLLQRAWHEREMAKPKTSSPPPERRTTIPVPEPVVPRPVAPLEPHAPQPERQAAHPRPERVAPQAAAPPEPRAHPKKQHMSILDQISAKSKQAKEKQARQLNNIHHGHSATEDDDSDAEAQRQAEENHALALPPPYQPLRPHKADDARDQPAVLRVPPLQPSNLHRQLSPDDNDDDHEEDSPPHGTPKGPFAANSVAGVQAIKKSMPRRINLPFDDDELPSTTATQRFRGTAPKKFSFKKSAAKPDPLYITANDLQLYKWRQENVSWGVIKARWAALPNLDLASHGSSENSLRRRIKQVQPLIEMPEISQELCQEVVDGDKEAEVALNRILGYGSATPFRKNAKPDTAAAVAPIPVAPPAPRPAHGGKCVDEAAYLHYLDHQRAALDPDTDSEEQEPRQGSPMKDEDFVYWRYFMERRDFTADILAGQDFEDLQEDVEWMEYDHVFEHIGHANAEACKIVWCTPEALTTSDYALGDWTLQKRTDKNGMVHLTLTADDPEHPGVVQMRVGRRMMNYQAYVEPAGKKGWLPKTLYSIEVKTGEKADGVFNDTDTLTIDPMLGRHVYGSLNQANSAAIHEFVRLTRRPCSSNLDQIEIDRAGARNELQSELAEAGVETMFMSRLEDEGKIIEVAVKECGFQGPRN